MAAGRWYQGGGRGVKPFGFVVAGGVFVHWWWLAGKAGALGVWYGMVGFGDRGVAFCRQVHGAHWYACTPVRLRLVPSTILRHCRSS